MTLAELSTGLPARIAEVDGDDPGMRSRMFALGLRSGREVTVIRRAIFMGPLQIRIGSTDLIIRRRDARRVRLVPAR